jgi:hypothetical protein
MQHLCGALIHQQPVQLCVAHRVPALVWQHLLPGDRELAMGCTARLFASAVGTKRQQVIQQITDTAQGLMQARVPGICAEAESDLQLSSTA